MTDADEHLERLISRRLDGELTPDEAVELERLVRTHPEARRLLDEYARNDRLASQVLRHSFEGTGACPPIRARPIGRRREWLSYSLVAAMAACIAMVMIFRAEWSPPPPSGHATDNRQVRVPDRWLQNASQPPTPRPLWSTPVEYPQRRLMHTGRNVLGIRNPGTDRYYILEYNARTVRTVPVRGSL